MRNQLGFSLLELMISMMISAMLMTASFTIYNYITKSIMSVQNTAQADTTAMTVQRQITRDILGLCPLWFTNEPTQQPNENNQPPNSQPKQPTNPAVINNKYLLAISDDKQLKFITFISNNILPSYNKPRHRCVRVTYQLIKDPKNSDWYILQRKQDDTISNEINTENIGSGDFYTLANNITQCFLEYGFIKKEEKETNDQKWDMTWVSSWGEESNNAHSKQDTPQQPNMPDLIRITLKIQLAPHLSPKEYQLYTPLPIIKDVAFQSFAAQRKTTAKSPENPRPKE